MAAELNLRIMLTSQITACLFAVGRNGNNTTVAHFQPDQTAHKNPTLSALDKIRLGKLTDENKLKKKTAELRQKELRREVRGAGMELFAAQGKTCRDDDTVAVVGISRRRQSLDHLPAESPIDITFRKSDIGGQVHVSGTPPVNPELLALDVVEDNSSLNLPPTKGA